MHSRSLQTVVDPLRGAQLQPAIIAAMSSSTGVHALLPALALKRGLDRRQRRGLAELCSARRASSPRCRSRTA